MIITIKYADLSKSGKSLSVKDQDGNRYQCKDFSIQNMIGKAVDISTSTSEYAGKTFVWINDWAEVGTGEPGHAVSPPQGNPAGVLGQPATLGRSEDKEASITAQGIMKAANFRCDTADEAYAIYSRLKDLVSGQAEPSLTETPETPYSDDIPF